MSYRYECVLDWKAEQWFVTDAGAKQRQILETITEKAISTFVAKGEGKITGVESVRHSNVTYWTEWLGQLHKWSGTTTIVLLSSVAPASPAVPVLLVAIIKAILPYLGAIILTALVLGLFYLAYKTLTFLAEKAPEALALGAGALLLFVLLWAPRKEEVKK